MRRIVIGIVVAAVVVLVGTRLRDDSSEERTPRVMRELTAEQLINRVQRLRKESGLDVEDRIHLRVEASLDLKGAFSRFRELIENETLSELVLDPPGSSMQESKENIEGEPVRVGLEKKP